MKVYRDIDIKEFEFWAGAIENFKLFTEDEIETIQFILEDLYSEGIEEVQLNDIFWFELEWLAEIIGTTEEELIGRYDNV